MSEEASRSWIECRRCGDDTFQSQRWSYRYGDPAISERDCWIVYQCDGCGTVTLVHELWDFNEAGYERERYTPLRTYYPNSRTTVVPSWCDKLPDPLPDLFRETYTAHSYELYTLASIGVRTIVDRLLTEKIGDIGGFEGKLSKAVEINLITAAQKEVLSAIVEQGHASAHRGHQPGRFEAASTLEIVENIVASIYILPKVATEIMEKVPKR